MIEFQISKFFEIFFKDLACKNNLPTLSINFLSLTLVTFIKEDKFFTIRMHELLFVFNYSDNSKLKKIDYINFNK